jgi:hypothetical protein
MKIATPKAKNVQSAITWLIGYSTTKSEKSNSNLYISIINIIIALTSRKRIDK